MTERLISKPSKRHAGRQLGWFGTVMASIGIGAVCAAAVFQSPEAPPCVVTNVPHWNLTPDRSIRS